MGHTIGPNQLDPVYTTAEQRRCLDELEYLLDVAVPVGTSISSRACTVLTHDILATQQHPSNCILYMYIKRIRLQHIDPNHFNPAAQMTC